MSRFELRAGVRRLFRLPLRVPPAMHADVDEELDALIAARIDYLVARGMSPLDARAEALRRLGAGLEDVRHNLHYSAEHRERRMQFHEHLENLIHDVRYAVRGLMRRPGFTAVAVLTLAIGIGATTAIFSAVNVLLLRPLPFARPDELMKATLVTPNKEHLPRTDQMVWSYPKFVVLRDAQQVFSDLSLYSSNQVTIGGDDPERIRGEFVGATYLRTLGLQPARGRDFERSEDDHAGAPRQAILSYALWERRFNADPSVIGRTIDLDRNPYDIIGVAPRDFKGLTGQSEIFLPITTRAADDISEPYSHEFNLVARRAAGVSVAQAAAAVTVLGTRVNDAYPGGAGANDSKWGARAEPLDAGRVSPIVKRSLLVLFGAVALVLLIACVNVANLMLGRANARRREIAVRLAIGASRKRLVRLLVTESLLLAMIGGAASVVVAWFGVRALGGVNPATTLRITRDSGLGAVAFSSIGLDWTALAFTFTVALAVGLAFGILPALSATRASLTSALKEGRSESRAVRVLGGRQVLVISEVALALVLLAGSGLMIRSLSKLLATDTGFDGTNVLTARLTVSRGSIARDSMPQFLTQLLDRLHAIPGVSDASISNCAPLGGGCNGTVMRFLDRPEMDLDHGPTVGIHWASPTWFATMHIPLERGRVFTPTERMGTPLVVVVNETAAKKFWPSEDPIGKHVQVGQGGLKDAEVIGIVGDVRQRVDSAAIPEVYASYLQSPNSNMIIFVRTAQNPAAIGTALRRAIHDVAPTYPVYDMQTMSDRAAGATARARFSAVLLSLFAATALSLAAIGIYGVMSLAVTARTREIGIRIALGADRGRVQRLVVGEGALLVGVGAVAGIAIALASTRVLQTLLFDLTASDPVTYVAIVVILVGAALFASWIPARRAARLDPLTALRAD